MRAKDSMVSPSPMNSVDCDQSKKDPTAPIRIRRIPKLKKEITRMLIICSFSVERDQVGNRIVETETIVIDIYPFEPGNIQIFEILGIRAGDLNVSPERKPEKDVLQDLHLESQDEFGPARIEIVVINGVGFCSFRQERVRIDGRLVQGRVERAETISKSGYDHILHPQPVFIGIVVDTCLDVLSLCREVVEVFLSRVIAIAQFGR
jgi:hypothetical protein